MRALEKETERWRRVSRTRGAASSGRTVAPWPICGDFATNFSTFLQPARAERDLAREIDAHLDLLQDEFRRRGMDADEARLAAIRAYGGISRQKSSTVKNALGYGFEQVRQDLRFSADSAKVLDLRLRRS